MKLKIVMPEPKYPNSLYLLYIANVAGVMVRENGERSIEAIPQECSADGCGRSVTFTERRIDWSPESCRSNNGDETPSPSIDATDSEKE